MLMHADDLAREWREHVVQEAVLRQSQGRVRAITRVFVGLTVLMLFASAVGMAASPGANAAERAQERLLRALEREDFAGAERLLHEIEREDPALFARRHYEYLRARLRQRMGNREGAIRAFRRVLEREDLLSVYALWHLAEIARQQDDWERERAFLLQALEKQPAFWLEERLRWRLAENALRRNAFQEAIELYRAFAARSPEFAPVAQLKIALAYRQSGRAEEARALLLALSNEREPSRRTGNRPIRVEDLLGLPNDVALHALEQLDAWDRERSEALSPEEYRRRARLYRANRAFEPMREHYERLLTQFPEHPFVPEALLEIGRSYYAQGEFDRAIPWFERVAERFPNTPEGEQGLYLIGHAQARAGRWSEAIARYEAFLAAYPKSDALAGAHLNLIDALRSAGRDQEALLWCHRTRARFTGQPAAAAALFSQVRIRLGRGEFSAALGDLDELLRLDLDRPGPQVPDRHEVLYWRGRVLEALGRWEEAIDAYLALPDERDSYYGRRATERLRLLWTHPQAGSFVRQRFRELRAHARSALRKGDARGAKMAAQRALRLTPEEEQQRLLRRWLVRALRRLPEYARIAPWARLVVGCETPEYDLGETKDIRGARAAALVCLGLYDEGAWELAESWGWGEAEARSRLQSAAMWADPLDLSRLYTLAVFFHRGGYAHEALRIAEAYFAPLIPRDYPLDQLPGELARLLYPTPYERELQEQIARRGLDPALALALLREESRFRPDAKSPAAARGLAQFVPETARHWAERAGLRSFQEHDLYRPDVSLRLLGLLLEDLMRRFSGRLPLVLAAYNAGEDNAHRWLARARSDDPDRFVSEIGFRETKVYVRRVLVVYWAYREVIAASVRR